MSPPTTQAEWQAVADAYMERWQFPHTVGAIDGKHIRIRNPPYGGSEFYNYKHFFSIILMALVDTDYKFVWTHIGKSGSNNDAGIFMRSELRECLREGTLNLPDPEPLSGDTEPMPYYIIGDDAFPLRTWCMKPYSRLDLDIQHRVFNYRLSRTRRVVENAFGMLATKIRCLLNPMTQKPERVQTMVLAACCFTSERTVVSSCLYRGPSRRIAVSRGCYHGGADAMRAVELSASRARSGTFGADRGVSCL